MAKNCVDVAQAVLTAFDTSMSNAWREEEEQWHAEQQEWHQEDLEWMQWQRLRWLEERQTRHWKHRWREEDMVQRNLENARCLWLRFVERNRRDVEEKSEQLKAISNLAALFAGFAIVTLTQFNVQETYSLVLVGLYGVLTALVEGLMTISMVMCTLILGCILKIGKTYVNVQAEEEFIFQCFEFCQNYQEGDCPPCPKRTMEAFWECRCESSWQCAFICFSLGVSLFLSSLMLIGWIKYSRDSKVTAALFVSLCGIAVFIWCFVQYSWGKYVRRRQIVDDKDDVLGDCAGLPYDWYLAPNIRPTQ
eukprot:Gb_37702 [translate_table: standard]